MTDEEKRVMELINRIAPMLAGQGPHVQSAVLADLLAMWLAGHLPSEAREQVLANHIAVVRELTKINARELHGEN